MPELREEMYCSQQICIPPSFPYLLRQYAKAAIRTQPTDLLRWSTAYFRCLALNLRPPVKPRLEYPIPKSHFGLTPGWLKALIYQLQNNLTVPFKVLWDRWIGACLQHQNLIEILCLGGFTDPSAIPWFRFIALCAAHLTENLTQTMILVCEILTEEPEGGSAMVPLEVFTDLYKFLAELDASEAQEIRNLHFTDSLLSLYREPAAEEIRKTVSEVAVEEEEESVEEEEQKVEIMVEAPVQEDIGVAISCPDLAADDYKTEEDFLNRRPSDQKAEKTSVLSELPQQDPSEHDEASLEGASTQKPSEEEAEPAAKSDQEGSEEFKLESEDKSKDKEDTVSTSLSVKTQEVSEDEKPETIIQELAEEKKAEVQSKGSVETVIDYMPPRQRDIELLEDLEKLRMAQRQEEVEGEQEGEQEMDFEIEKLKRMLAGPVDVATIESEIVDSKELEEREEMGEEEAEPEELPGELVYVEAIPGIGPTVPEELLQTVIKYMHECSTNQQGMVMPRNVRHYSCPPLEVLPK